jgi:cellulose biosynthesis protein BcsQ
MNITLLAKKGGVGKSTVSILLYEAFIVHNVLLREVWDS